MNDFRKGDMVLVSFKAEYAGQKDDTAAVRVTVLKDGHPTLITLADGATVEVLERADDPARDLTGSIRRTKTVTCIARERDGGADFHRWIAVEMNEAFTDAHMRGSHVIGAVPGTPAAEAQRPFSVELKLPPFAVGGEVERAQQQRHQLCTLNECVAAPRCSSGATVWHDKTSECRGQTSEPRVFRSDGPEPPVDVQVVTDSHHHLPYLVRFQGGWCWSQEKDRLAGAGHSPAAVEWRSAAVHSQNAELREVFPS